MNERQYHDLLDDLMVAIEDAIEDAELDIDYETVSGVLTLACADHSKVILSRQTPVLQLWLAAKSGGFHFDYDKSQKQWIADRNGESLATVLNQCLSQQSGYAINLAID